MNTRLAGRGFSLLEVMIALLVVTFGIIGIVKFQGELFQSGAVSKQRSIATALAQERMEELRAYLDGAGYAVVESLDGTPNNAAVAGIFGPSDGEQFQRDGTTFTRLTSVRAQTLPTRLLDVEVVVDWTTSTDSDERVTLRSAVAWADPVNSAIIMSDPAIVATGNCPTASVQDGLCVGTASGAADGQTVSVSYTQGGSGTGQWLCQGGVWVAPDPSACQASCPQQVVSDPNGFCSGTAAPTPYGQTTTVSFSSGGTGSGTYLCDGGTWLAQSVTCNPGCNLPWGGVIASGSSVLAYQSDAPSNVSCGDSSNTETRTCNSGSLSGSFTFPTCSQPCLAADHGGDFGDLAHGTTIQVYEFAEAETCDLQERTCTNGILSGVGKFMECTPTGTEECIVEGVAYPPGAVRTFYGDDSAPDCGDVAAQFVCDGGDGKFKQNSVYYADMGYYPRCSDDDCSYTLTITGGNNQFCEGGTLPGSCTWSNNKKSITCSGEFAVGETISFNPVPQRKQGNKCNAISVGCSPASLTCTTAAVNTGVSCTP